MADLAEDPGDTEVSGGVSKKPSVPQDDSLDQYVSMIETPHGDELPSYFDKSVSELEALDAIVRSSTLQSTRDKLSEMSFDEHKRGSTIGMFGNSGGSLGLDPAVRGSMSLMEIDVTQTVTANNMHGDLLRLERLYDDIREAMEDRQDEYENDWVEILEDVMPQYTQHIDALHECIQQTRFCYRTALEQVCNGGKSHGSGQFSGAGFFALTPVGGNHKSSLFSGSSADEIEARLLEISKRMISQKMELQKRNDELIERVKTIVEGLHSSAYEDLLSAESDSDTSKDTILGDSRIRQAFDLMEQRIDELEQELHSKQDLITELQSKWDEEADIENENEQLREEVEELKDQLKDAQAAAAAATVAAAAAAAASAEAAAKRTSSSPSTPPPTPMASAEVLIDDSTDEKASPAGLAAIIRDESGSVSTDGMVIVNSGADTSESQIIMLEQKDEEIKQLRERCRTLDENHGLSDEISILKMRSEKLQSDLQAYKKETSALQNQLSSLEREKKRLNLDLQNLDEELIDTKDRKEKTERLVLKMREEQAYDSQRKSQGGSLTASSSASQSVSDYVLTDETLLKDTTSVSGYSGSSSSQASSDIVSTSTGPRDSGWRWWMYFKDF